MRIQSTRIRHDMLQENREKPQHFSVQYLDKFLMEAFTAYTGEDARSAERRLADIQEQIVKHLFFLSELEGVHRSLESEMAYDVDEYAYTSLVTFLSALGAGLSDVSQQLGFTESRFPQGKPGLAVGDHA